MTFTHILIAAAAVLTSSIASAAAIIPQIRYELAATDLNFGVTMSFAYTSPGFIAGDRSVRAADLDRCTVAAPVGGTCANQNFYGNFFGYTGVSYGTPEQGGIFIFQSGALLQTGTYDSFSQTERYYGTLKVSEVAGTVPEPASWAMMIAGFGLVGAAARRRADRAVLPA